MSEMSSDADDAPSSDSSGAALTDEQHDWASAFTGIDTRAASDNGAAAAGASAPAADSGGSGGFFSGIANAVSDVASGALNTVENVASDVGHTLSDTASGIVNTVETTASDIGHTLSDAAGGVVNTVTTVAGDVTSGNFGDALGDAEKGAATTFGQVVDDTAHTVVDAGSGLLNTVGKIITDTNQTMTDAATGVVATTGKAVSDVAQGVAQAAGPDSVIGQAASAVGDASTAVASGAVSAINTMNDFNKGVVEGVVGGVEGMATGLVSLGEGVAKEGYALATDEKAREQAGQTVLHGLQAVGNFEMTMVTDPSKAMGQVADAASGAVNTVETMAGNVYKGYQAAAAQGHGAEFIGKGVGQVGVLVAGAVLTDGASLAGEGAAVAGEGVALAGEGAALLGEGAAVAGEGAAALGEGAAVVGEGVTAAGEGAAMAGEGAAAAGEGAVAAGEGAAATGEGVDAAGEVVSDATGATPEGEGSLRATGGEGGPPPPSEPPPESAGGGGEPPDEPPELTEEQQRQADILEEFAEQQQRHGAEQMEVADEAPAPNLEEPDRIPELTQGPEPDQRLAKLRDIKFSQADVSPAMGDGTPIEEVAQNMADEGWDPTKPDADVVANEDGSLTSIDNRRLVAADAAGIDEVPVQVHAADSALPEEMADRFPLKNPLTDPATGETIPGGTNADTWGDGAKFRAANQGKEFPLDGSARKPDVRVPKQSTSSPASTQPSVEQRAADALQRLQEVDPKAREALEEFEAAERAREADLAGQASGAR
jgi:hypothetical protein